MTPKVTPLGALVGERQGRLHGITRARPCANRGKSILPKLRKADDDERAPSREEIETLCILYAIGPDGCRVGELAMRLGLSAAMGSAVAEGTRPLITAGWVDLSADRFALTEAGHLRLKDRLSELLHRVSE